MIAPNHGRRHGLVYNTLVGLSVYANALSLHVRLVAVMIYAVSFFR